MAKRQYYCTKCKKNHLVTSKIGKKHKEFSEAPETKKTKTKKVSKKSKAKKNQPDLPELPDINSIKVAEKGFGFFSGVLILVLVSFFAALALYTYQQNTLDEFKQQESLTAQIRQRLGDSKYSTTQLDTEATVTVEEIKEIPIEAWKDEQSFYYLKEEDGQTKTYVYNLVTKESVEKETVEEEAEEETAKVEEELDDNQTQTIVNSPDGEKTLKIRITKDRQDEGDDQHEIVQLLVDDEEIFSSQGDNEEQSYLTNIQATWSPDGEYLIYNYNRQLWLIKSDGTNNKQLTTLVRDYLQPRWSSDGEYLIYLLDGKIYYQKMKVKNILSQTVNKKVATL